MVLGHDAATVEEESDVSSAGDAADVKARWVIIWADVHTVDHWHDIAWGETCRVEIKSLFRGLRLGRNHRLCVGERHEKRCEQQDTVAIGDHLDHF